ncbi:MAG: hypothetical protein M5R42_06065 [Rhodocyclaceae bacterium]|nr:hypothetical protein [Rhodocyclaceae bacterium]
MPEAFDTAQSAGSDIAALLYTSRHHRPREGGDALPPQPGGKRPGTPRLLGVPPRRRAAAHAAHLSRARPFVATHCALLNGSPILFEPEFDPQRALRLMQDATVFMGMPAYFTPFCRRRR